METKLRTPLKTLSCMHGNVVYSDGFEGGPKLGTNYVMMCEPLGQPRWNNFSPVVAISYVCGYINRIFLIEFLSNFFEVIEFFSQVKVSLN